MTRSELIIFFFSSLLLFCTTGCKDGDHTRLTKVNRLIETGESDSALHELATVYYKGLSRDDQALYNLLKVKALYRSYQVLATDSLINSSIATFQFGGRDSLLADAYYYKAAMASDREKDKGYVKVMGCLKMAENIAVKKHYSDIEKKIYDRVSNYNIVSGEYKTALSYAKKQYALANRLHDNYFKAYSLDQLLKSYYMLKEKDSVSKYHRLSWDMKKYIPADELPDYLNDLYVTLGLVNPNKAIAYFEDLLHDHPSALFQGNLACLYDKTGQHERADSLWRKALQTTNLFEKSGILIDMIQRKQQDHLYQEAMKAQLMLNAVNDSLEHIYREDDLGDGVEDHTSQIYHSLRARNVVLFFSVIFAVILFSVLVIFLYHRKLHQRTLMFYKLYDQLSHVRGSMEKIQQEDQGRISMLESALEKLKEEHAQTFSHGRMLYEEIKSNHSVTLWKKKDFLDFIDYYMSIDFKFLQSLNDNYKNLTPSEIFYLILVHEGYEEATVKDILGISSTALRVRKSRINKKRR